jgi:hypothetical protein
MKPTIFDLKKLANRITAEFAANDNFTSPYIESLQDEYEAMKRELELEIIDDGEEDPIAIRNANERYGV